MRLTHDAGDGTILYDDHGAKWQVTLDLGSAPSADASAGERTRVGSMTKFQPTLRFRSAEHEPMVVRYEGDERRATDLSLGDVVTHFLRATE